MQSMASRCRRKDREIAAVGAVIGVDKINVCFEGALPKTGLRIWKTSALRPFHMPRQCELP